MKDMTLYEAELLAGWEEAYKKGQLTLLILLALKDGPKHMASIKDFIKTVTNGNLAADDKSLYRSLRRHNTVEMIDFKQLPGNGGPERKVYHLTDIGMKVLDEFVARNINALFDQPLIKPMLKRSK